MTNEDVLETLASYVPTYVVRHLTEAAAAPGEATTRRFSAVVLYVRIDGLADLVSRFEASSAGEARLKRTLDVYFWQVIDVILGHGGDLVSCAGHSLLVMWPLDATASSEAQTRQQASGVHRAAECGLALREALHAYDATEDVQLLLRMGVDVGEVTAFSVGGSLGRWEFLIAGEPVNGARALVARAGPGDVVLSARACGAIEKQCVGERLSGGAFRLQETRYPLASVAQSAPALAPSMEMALRTYVPGAVLNRLSTQQIGRLVELRPITVLSVNVPAVTHDTPAAEVQSAMRRAQQALYRHAGSVSALHIDERGMVLVAAFGLPPVSHKYDPAQAVRAAQALRSALTGVVGVATGTAFCGSVGNHRRRVYTVMGKVVARAEALRERAAQGRAEDAPRILCDAATQTAAQDVLDTACATPEAEAAAPPPQAAPPRQAAPPPQAAPPRQAAPPQPAADDRATSWTPAPVLASEFHRSDEEANINRAPLDQVAGVIYKRALNIQRVRYEPAAPAPEMPAPWQGQGSTVVRWLFSELRGTEEGLLAGARFAFLHDVTLAPGASTGQRAQPGLDKVLYVLAGQGQLAHRPTDGSPVLARPLRPGDAALIRGGEYHSIANPTDDQDLRLIVLGLA